MMVDKELDEILLMTEKKILSIFTELMTRVAKLDELVDAGKRFLMMFSQELAKTSLDEIECLVEDAYKVMIEAERDASRFIQERDDESLMDQTMSSEDKAEPFDVKEKPASYATMMMAIYNMLKLDYTMQEKIVRSLSLKTSSSELETYCLMWDLRPYVDFNMMHHAWKSMP